MSVIQLDNKYIDILVDKTKYIPVKNSYILIHHMAVYTTYQELFCQISGDIIYVLKKVTSYTFFDITQHLHYQGVKMNITLFQLST